jgi:phosphoribosylaminoimidazolecarboxamide formyltransferase/IMP cyclohydrolase
MTSITIRRALLSVSDKTGIVELGQALAAKGVELVSTGGTSKVLRDAGLEVRDISDLTGFPEMMDGRVKTLHPVVHGGLLAVRDDAGHMASASDHAIGMIDLVVVNLYPFAQTVAKGASRDEIIENIDIGGPSMVRSAAKNHAFVAIVTDPADYAVVAAGETTLEDRKRFAAKAYALTAQYDSTIASWFAFADQGERFPETLPLVFKRGEELRYGENPHQSAALYLPAGPATPGIAQAEQLQGKELSYNNYNDADAALELVSEFRDGPPTVVIVKHANPCGVATAETLVDAYKAALACDSVSAFGGIIALNRPLDTETAKAITDIFTEVVVAPGASDEAKAIFAAKKNLRLLICGDLPNPARPGLMLKTIAGGALVQSRDSGQVTQDALKVVTKRAPTSQELTDCLFADGLLAAVEAGATAVIQPGGSIRDDEVIAAADEAGLAMVFTGMRHFRH